MHGGTVWGDWDTSLGLDSVYVLSLPAFHWQQANYTPQYVRFGATCNVINRQMIVVGGNIMTQQAISENNGTWPYSVVDPWPQGLGVFDITDMEWKDSYDAGAGPYRTPEMVKQYYASHPRYSSSVLDDTVLRSWFDKGELHRYILPAYLPGREQIARNLLASSH